MKKEKPKDATKAIKINCYGAIKVDLDELHELQKNLKSLSKKNFEKLKGLILSQGFSFPLRLWRDNHSKIHIVGGHQAVRVLRALKEEGYLIPKLPASLVQAENKKAAVRLALADASVFGSIDIDGLYELSELYEVQDLDSYSFPEFDVKDLKKDEPKEQKEDKGVCSKCGQTIKS